MLAHRFTGENELGIAGLAMVCIITVYGDISRIKRSVVIIINTVVQKTYGDIGY